MSDKPVFTELSDGECRAILAGNHIGRIAFAHQNRVNVHPIGYVFRENWLACRTQEGGKIEVLRRSPYVAFEVDEVEGPLDWRSVVVQGSVYEEDFPTASREETLAALRSIMPSVLTPDDPTPQRHLLFRIHIREMTGRSATTKS